MLAAVLRLARMAERYCERLDRSARSYESTQLLVSARAFVRAVELYSEWVSLEVKTP